MKSVTVSGGDKLKATLQKLGQDRVKTVKAGFYDKAAYPDGTPIVDVAIWNEFGTETAPARPFMKNAFNKNNEKWFKLFNKMLMQQVAANKLDIKQIFNTIGLVMQGDIRDSIVKGNYVPNSPTTIAIKGKDSTLRDTNVMLNAVQYEVK